MRAAAGCDGDRPGMDNGVCLVVLSVIATRELVHASEQTSGLGGFPIDCRIAEQEATVRQLHTCLVIAGAVMALSACGSTEPERAGTGAGMGAATGAVVGGPVGALAGAGVGAATGAVTEQDEIDMGPPPWQQPVVEDELL